jgi:hypothetical protein
LEIKGGETMRNLKALTLGLALAIVPVAAYAQTTDMSKTESSVQFSKAPAVSSVTGSSATISWSTDKASSGKLQYRPTSGGEWKTANATASNGQKDFTVALTGLQPGQTYEYQLLTNTGTVRTSGQFQTSGSSTASGASATSSERAEQAVQITSGPTITVDATGSNATIKWTTNNVAANQVQYRPTSGGTWKNAYERQGSRDHTLQMTALQPNTTYEYKILTRDGDTRTSGQFQSAANATSSGSATSSAASTAGATGAAAPGSSSGRVALYRAVNNSTGAHVFSTSQTSLPSGFNQEGVAGYLMATQASGTAPLYALTSANGDFFYTADASERQKAISSLGFTDQGIAGYVSTSQQSGTVPFYRLVNASNGLHFYTADPSERSRVMGQGYKDEGTVGYIWQAQQ